MYKLHNDIIIDYKIAMPPKDLAFATYASEMDFIESGTAFCKWTFKKSVVFEDGETGFSLSVPFIMEVIQRLSSPNIPFGFVKEKMYTICEEFVSALYFF